MAQCQGRVFSKYTAKHTRQCRSEALAGSIYCYQHGSSFKDVFKHEQKKKNPKAFRGKSTSLYYCRKCKRQHRSGTKIYREHLKN